MKSLLDEAFNEKSKFFYMFAVQSDSSCIFSTRRCSCDYATCTDLAIIGDGYFNATKKRTRFGIFSLILYVSFKQYECKFREVRRSWINRLIIATASSFFWPSSRFD